MENNLTSKEAISNAVRLLEQAEMELDQIGRAHV